MSTPLAVVGVKHITPEGSTRRAAVADQRRRRRARVPTAEATRRFSHSTLERSEPALAVIRGCVAAMCSQLDPTPNEPGKHLLSHAGTTAVAPKLDSTTDKAVDLRVGVALA